MRIYLRDIPKGKKVDDYPEDTEFVLSETNKKKYEVSAFVDKGVLQEIKSGEKGYEKAKTIQEIFDMIVEESEE